MTVLALRMAGNVARRMWKDLWPGAPLDEVPIGRVTYGVHYRFSISHEMKQLYERYLGPSRFFPASSLSEPE